MSSHRMDDPFGFRVGGDAVGRVNASCILNIVLCLQSVVAAHRQHRLRLLA